ncbi:hypothetical protein N7U49_48335 (plasmid) [Streptomyces sp. AD2-2]|nr:hypothetical protein N7U49_48335 [Streptomyces sp. AD2-2]
MREEQLEPLAADTSEVLAVRSRLEQELAIHAQIEQLEEMKASVSNAVPAPPPARPDGIPAADVSDFEQAIHQTLQAWHVPGENRVTYNPTTAEIAVDGRPGGAEAMACGPSSTRLSPYRWHAATKLAASSTPDS